MIAYNVEAVKCDLVFTVNDTISMYFQVERNDVAYDMTGMQIDIHVRYNGTLIREFSTAGLAPEVSILVDTFYIDGVGFTKVGKFKYDVQVTDGTDVITIMKGNLYVQNEQTT